ncbi:MAG: hypothetical protein ACI358_01205 [Candidatus Limimorpha sp.]
MVDDNTSDVVNSVTAKNKYSDDVYNDSAQLVDRMAAFLNYLNTGNNTTTDTTSVADKMSVFYMVQGSVVKIRQQ